MKSPSTTRDADLFNSYPVADAAAPRPSAVSPADWQGSAGRISLALSDSWRGSHLRTEHSSGGFDAKYPLVI